MATSVISDIMLGAAGIEVLRCCHYIRPLHVSSKLDPSKYGKTFLPITFSNKRITILTLFVPTLIAMTTQLLIPSVDGFRLGIYYLSRFCLIASICAVVKLLTSEPRPNAIYLEEAFTKMNHNFESRQSFFSAHAAAGLFATLFLKTFFVKSFPDLIDNHLIVKGFINFLPILGFYSGYTQWKQNWHHSHDVLIGYAYGIITYYLVFDWKYD